LIIWFQLNISPFLFIVRYNKNTNVSIPFNLMSSKILNRDALLSIASTLFWHCLINMWFPKEKNMNESNEIYFHQEVLHLRGDRIGCVIVRVLASSVVYLGLEPQLGQTKDYKIGICCFSDKLKNCWVCVRQQSLTNSFEGGDACILFYRRE
jgi:hypothetical protein